MKVAIVAMGPSGFEYIASRWHGVTFDEVWGINHASLEYPGVTMTVHMDDLQRDRFIDREYVEKLEASNLPVLTSTSYWRQCIAYPLNDVQDLIWNGNEPVPPLDNTISFAIAYAILKKVDELHLFGVDFCQPDRPEMMPDALKAFEAQYPGLEAPDWFMYHDRNVVKHRRGLEPGSISSAFLLGYASARGMTIGLPRSTTLLDNDRTLRIHGYQVRPLRRGKYSID